MKLLCALLLECSSKKKSLPSLVQRFGSQKIYLQSPYFAKKVLCALMHIFKSESARGQRTIMLFLYVKFTIIVISIVIHDEKIEICRPEIVINSLRVLKGYHKGEYPNIVQ